MTVRFIFKNGNETVFRKVSAFDVGPTFYCVKHHGNETCYGSFGNKVGSAIVRVEVT